MKYPYAKHNIRDEDINAVVDVLKHKSITQGESVLRFEKDLSKFLGCKEVVVCSSGTAALHLIYLSIGLDKDTAILTTPITFLATANAARMTGAKVYFADVDPMTGLICKNSVYKTLKKLKNKIKALVIVHLGSKVCDLEYFKKIADEFNILLIEDACHALGQRFISEDKITSLVGSAKYSDAASFSFHAIKNITTGEGGAVATNNKDLAKIMRLYRSHGTIRDIEWNNKKQRGPWYYQADTIGYNYRLTDFQASLGSSQLKNLNNQNKHKCRVAEVYISLLKDCDHIYLPKVEDKKTKQAWHLFAIQVDFKKLKKNKNIIMKKLEEKGIGTQVHYIPLYKQPVYSPNKDKIFTGSEIYYEMTLSLPMYAGLKNVDLRYIVKNLKNILYS